MNKYFFILNSYINIYMYNKFITRIKIDVIIQSCKNEALIELPETNAEEPKKKADKFSKK